MEQNWEYLEKIHPDNAVWKIYKQRSIKNVRDNKSIVYYGILNGRVISEATAMLSDNPDIQNIEGLADSSTIYLSAFRTIEEYQGKGYFSELYKFMENDLKSRGYNKLTLGVEPSEVKNMMIYFKYGFTDYIKTAYETEPTENEQAQPRKIIVNYYAKNI